MSEQNEDGIEIGVSWEKVDKNGNSYHSIKLDGNFQLFVNKFCDPEKNHPTHRLLAYKKYKKGDQNQENVQETVQTDNEPESTPVTDKIPF